MVDLNQPHSPLLLPASARPADQGIDPSTGSIYFVGTATVILRYAGLTILTDPNFLHQGDHVHLGYGLVSKRLTEPALDVDRLPPVDFVVLSHFHGDHFDRIAERRLDKNLPIVTTPHAARKLRRRGFRKPLALRPWQSLDVFKDATSARVTAMPGKHGPGGASALLPPVMGSMLDLVCGDYSARVYISGDTIIHDELRKIPEQYPNVDIALLHLGGTRVLGILVTMDADQGVEMIRIIDPRLAIPIHYNDYKVFKSPLEDFVRAVEQAGLADRVRYLKHGDSYQFKLRAGQYTARPLSRAV